MRLILAFRPLSSLRPTPCDPGSLAFESTRPDTAPSVHLFEIHGALAKS